MKKIHENEVTEGTVNTEFAWLPGVQSTQITVINAQTSFYLQSSGEINVGKALFSLDHYLIFI
jgi:hypothetical protein